MNDSISPQDPGSTNTQTPKQPTFTTPSNSLDYAEIEKSNRKKLIWGLICLLGPSLLFILAIIAYVVINFVTSSFTPASADLFQAKSPIVVAVNVLVFLVGIAVILTWLPGIILGIILLATRRKFPPRT